MPFQWIQINLVWGILKTHIVIIGNTLERCKNQGWKSLYPLYAKSKNQSCKQILKTPEPGKEINLAVKSTLSPAPDYLLPPPRHPLAPSLHCWQEGYTFLISFTNTVPKRTRGSMENIEPEWDQLSPLPNFFCQPPPHPRPLLFRPLLWLYNQRCLWSFKGQLGLKSTLTFFVVIVISCLKKKIVEV